MNTELENNVNFSHENLLQSLTKTPFFAEITNYLWPKTFLCTSLVKDNPALKKFHEFANFKAEISGLDVQKLLKLYKMRSQNILKFNLFFDEFQIAGFIDILQKYLPQELQKKIDFNNDEMQTKIWKYFLPHVKKHIFKALRKSNDEKAIEHYKNKLMRILKSPGIKNKIILSLRLSTPNRLDGVVVNKNAEFLDFFVCYPFSDEHRSIIELARIIIKNDVEQIVISNIHQWKNIDKLIDKTLTLFRDIKTEKIVVSDAGALGYTEKQQTEPTLFLDPPLLKALFIAKRVISPLQELKNIEPKYIVFDVFQSEVNQTDLVQKFKETIELSGQSNQNNKNLPKNKKFLHTKKIKEKPKTLLNTSMRDALQKLKYGEKS